MTKLYSICFLVFIFATPVSAQKTGAANAFTGTDWLPTSKSKLPVGSASGSYVSGSQTVASTIDAANGSYTYKYDTGFTNMPIVLLLHGWAGSSTSFVTADYNRWAARGCFVAAINSRQAYNVGGREAHDIYDIVQDIKTRFPSVVSPYQTIIVGYSNGGGASLQMASKFPDLFDLTIDFFGMSDFGYDGTYGWYYTNTGWQSSLDAQIGVPASNADKYRSRNAVEAITNYQGRLVILHSDGDGLVAVSHSQRIASAMTGRRFTYYEGDNTTIPHGYPSDNAALVTAESNFTGLIGLQPRAELSASGNVRVIGFLKCERFSIWLGDGTSEVVDLAYNTTTRNYTVTPLTGSVSVTITQGAYSATQTVSTATTLTL